MIVLSEIVSESPQADGRVYVRERHVDEHGHEYTFESLLPADTDRNALLSARAEILNQQLASRAAIEKTVSVTTLPLSKLEFLRRFTPQERIAIRKSQNDLVQDFINLLNLAEYVTPSDGDSQAALAYLESIGLIASGRAAEIGAGNG